MAYKVFTNGSVLAASEINENLMRQAVIVFSNSTARAAAITSPNEGMLTYLEDTNKYESYNGSAWVVLGEEPGLTKIVNSSFTAQTSISVNNAFTSTYKHYKVLLDITAKSADGGITTRLRLAGTDTSSATYNHALRTIRTNAGGEGSGAANDTKIVLGYANTSATAYSFDVFNPNLASNTMLTIQGWGGDLSTWFASVAGGNQLSTTQFDGLTIFSTVGTITGTITIYGYRN
jgi:hypothetical protein